MTPGPKPEPEPREPVQSDWDKLNADRDEQAPELRWVHLGQGHYLFQNGDHFEAGDREPVLGEGAFGEVVLHGYEERDIDMVIIRLRPPAQSRGHRPDIPCDAFLCLPEKNPGHYR